jgi:murein DD-endopeptidase MepM/ murein hydrolase activator NlpD
MTSGGIIARTGSTGQSTGPHLDARWADGRPISAADADRYLSVNGRSPSSYGVTSGYGPRSLFGRSFHRGIDFGTPSGSGVSLKGGASLLRDLGFTGAGGYAVEIDTPEGRMRLLHLQGGSAARPVGSARQLIGRPGAAAAAASGVDMSGIDAAGKRLDAASGANRSASLAAAAGELVNSRQAELGTITSQLDQQRKSVREQREDFERMLELQRSGLTPELARQVAERERMARTEDASLQKLRDQLTLDLQGNDLTQQQRIAVEKILADTILRQQALQGVVEGLNTEEQALSRLQQAYEQKRQLVEGIANSIGNGIGSAIDLLIDGTDNWGDSLRQIAAGVLKDIARQIAQTMVVAPIVKGLTSAFGFANGGIMTGDGPMPLRKYAAGGIASSPQLAMFGEGSMPEAYVPLPDGRRIPVAMKGGGGGTNVTVNVDATGSQVQGNSGQGEQLGRAISQAVQNELVRQKRPGGLLAA